MQNYDSCRLVDDLAPRSRADAGRPELSVGGHGRQSLIDHPHRHWCDGGGYRLGVRESCLRCRTAGAVHRQRQANNDLDHAAFGDESSDPV